MIFETVRELLAHQLEVSPESITPETDIFEDLGADSLDVVELVMSIEEEYDIVITDERAANVRTVEQLVEMLEIALVDLCGKLEGVPSNHLLGLDELHPVCGVHVILSDKVDEVTESARWARNVGKSAFIKAKLFGDTQLDCDVIRAVRSECPAGETFLIGDVNCGYRPEDSTASLDWITE